MTPKDKANDLVNNMFNCDNSTPEKSMAMLLIHAKQCALIAVDETLRALHFNVWINVEEIKYWKEVKQEIEKL
jgi:hypothetical protein